MSSSGMMLFAGNSNPELVQDIAARLNQRLGRAMVGKFSDGEVMAEIHESVRGRDVYVIQSTCQPTNDNLMEMLVIIDALRWASAARITAVFPYFGYARQDRRPRSARVPITARLIAKQIEAAGADRVITVDLHADQIHGFFDIQIDNIYALPILLGDVWRQKYPDLIVVSPDVGGVVRARALAKHLDDAELAIIDKRRPNANEAQVMHIIGNVEGRSCVLIDDMVDTAGTLCKAAQALKDHGALRVVAYCTHPVLSGPAVRNLEDSVLDELVVSNTIPLREEAQNSGKVRQISIAELLAETLRRIANDESVTSLFVG
ncbi:MAG: ribose-phosphate diphosphokinase [Gammaproteobacteria bacterium]|nr:ribose-phosphate diphosphokinase [Gammaproteobacteria bacterium]